MVTNIFSGDLPWSEYIYIYYIYMYIYIIYIYIRICCSYSEPTLPWGSDGGIGRHGPRARACNLNWVMRKDRAKAFLNIAEKQHVTNAFCLSFRWPQELEVPCTEFEGWRTSFWWESRILRILLRQPLRPCGACWSVILATLTSLDNWVACHQQSQVQSTCRV